MSKPEFPKNLVAFHFHLYNARKKNTCRLDWVAFTNPTWALQRQDILMVCLCCLLVPCVCRRSTSRCWASWCCNTSKGTRSPPERDVGDQCWVRRALLFIENYTAPSPRSPLSLPFPYWWFVTQLLNSPIFTRTTSLLPFFSAFIPLWHVCCYSSSHFPCLLPTVSTDYI